MKPVNLPEGLPVNIPLNPSFRVDILTSVQNRSREGCMAVPMVSFVKGATFGCYQRRVPSFRVAGLALRDIQTCFVTCRKSFLCGRRDTFAPFTQHIPTISHLLVVFSPLRLSVGACSPGGGIPLQLLSTVVFPVVFPALCPPWCSFCSASGSCAPGVALFPRVALASRSSPQPWP